MRKINDSLRAASLAPVGNRLPLGPQGVLGRLGRLRLRGARIDEELGRPQGAVAHAAKHPLRVRVVAAANNA